MSRCVAYLPPVPRFQRHAKLLRLTLSNNNAHTRKYNIVNMIHLQMSECITSVASARTADTRCQLEIGRARFDPWRHRSRRIATLPKELRDITRTQIGPRRVVSKLPR